MPHRSHSPVHYAKGTRSGIARLATGHSPLTACWHVVSGPISLPLQGCFSTFPHGTSALSVTKECLALAGGPADFRQGSTCLVVLGNASHGVSSGVAYGAFALCGAPFQALPLPARLITPRQVRHPAQMRPITPTLQRQRACTAPVWAGPGSLAATTGFDVLFLFLQVMRCFSSLGIASTLLRGRIPPHDWRRVAPFGDLRINACLRLPGAYRSLPRPSSPPRAKSSTTRP